MYWGSLISKQNRAAQAALFNQWKGFNAMTKDKIRAAISVAIDAEANAVRARIELLEIFSNSLEFKEMDKCKIILRETKNKASDLLKLLEFYGGAK
jgi:ferritin-like protein